MSKDMLICRCLDVFSRKQGMTILLIICRCLDDCCCNRGVTPTLLSYLGNFSFLSYSCLTRVSMDPRNKSEDDCYKKNASKDDCSECMSEEDKRECELEDDCYKKNASEEDKRECALEGEPRECVSNNDFTLRSLFRGGSFLLSSLRGDNRGQVIYKLEKGANRKIPGIFLLCRKIGMTMMMWILVSSLTMTNIAHAECTPAPDCAKIGYTETSCEGDSLKCPFDISKLFCIPCDTSFKYDCSGNNITGGVGSACNGKYVSCECASGTIFENGSCVCDTSCTVGAIYYSDKTCSACLVSDKTAIGVVVKDNELVMSQISSSSMKWGTYGTDISGLTNYSSSSGARADFNGKSNTAVIIAGDGGAAAAKYCNSYSTDGTSTGDWYLPAAGELHTYVYGNYSAINTTITSLSWSWGSSCLWSSSEYSSINSWCVSPNDYSMSYPTKGITVAPVACFLEI